MYQTQPGTIPHRAVEYLKQQDAGTQISAADFADRLDGAPETLVTTLVIACKHGALKRRRAASPHSNRQVWWYALGDGTPEAPDHAQRQHDAAIEARSAAMAAAAPPPAPKKRASGAPFDAWLSSSGILLLEGVRLDDAGRVELTPEQTRAVRQLIAWSAPA